MNSPTAVKIVISTYCVDKSMGSPPAPKTSTKRKPQILSEESDVNRTSFYISVTTPHSSWKWCHGFNNSNYQVTTMDKVEKAPIVLSKVIEHSLDICEHSKEIRLNAERIKRVERDLHETKMTFNESVTKYRQVSEHHQEQFYPFFLKEGLSLIISSIRTNPRG